MNGSERTKKFFEVYLVAPIVICFCIFLKLWKKNWKFHRLADIDITSGTPEIDLAQILADERAVQATRPW